jgi:hypothetical protein
MPLHTVHLFSHLLVLVAHDGKQIEHIGGDSDAMCDQTLFKKSVKKLICAQATNHRVVHASRPGGSLVRDIYTPSISVLEDVFDCDTVFKTQL